MPPADTNETRNFEVQDSYAFFDAGASKKKVIVVCAGFLPSHLSLTDYFRSADLNRKIVENPPPEFFAAPPSNDCLVILSDDALAHCASGETAFAVFLTDPVNRLISEFCLMANISTTPMPFGGKSYISPFRDRDDLIARRLETMLNSSEDLNFMTHALAQWSGNVGGDAPGQAVTYAEPITLAAAYERASELLNDKFAVVGITEYMAQSLFYLFGTFGWKSIPLPDEKTLEAHLTPTPVATDFPVRVQRLLQTVTEYDRRLYEQFRDKFELQMDEEPSLLEIREYQYQSEFSDVKRDAKYRRLEEKYAALAEVNKALVNSNNALVVSNKNLVAGYERSLDRSRTSYEALLKQHLLATGVLEAGNC